MTDYIPLVDEIELCEVDGEEYDDSFLSQLRKKRNDRIKNMKYSADKGAEKYFPSQIYSDIKLLNEDVKIMTDYIEKMATEKPEQSLFSFRFRIQEDAWLKSSKKLYEIYNNFSSNTSLLNNSLFLRKYWTFVESTMEIYTSALAQKTGAFKIHIIYVF